jgi:hypothetical protein
MVEASPLAPVGVLLDQEGGGRLVDVGWAFPYRVGSLTQFLHPDQFGVYESMTARRAAAILNSIPTSQREHVNLRWVDKERSLNPGGAMIDSLKSLAVRFLCLDFLGNVASFSELNGADRVDVPLDQITTVWRKTEKTGQAWEVSVSGCLRKTDSGWLLWPRT